MNLLKPVSLSNSLQIAYNFFRDSQLDSIMSDSEYLCNILDEFIFYMNENYGIYNDRVVEKKLKNVICIDHVYNFSKLTQGSSITDEEKNLIIDFYEELLKFVDQIIGTKYILGKKITKKEIKIINKTEFNRLLVNKCSIKNIIVYVPKKMFCKKKFNKYSKDYSDTGLIGSVHYTESYAVVEFVNINNNFYYCHIHGIKYCCNRSMTFKIDYEQSKDSELIILFDNM